MALMKFVQQMPSGAFKTRKNRKDGRVRTVAPKPSHRDVSARRPNQVVGSFTDMSEADRKELADLLEAELAHL